MKPDTWLTAWKLWAIFAVALASSLLFTSWPLSYLHLAVVVSMGWLLFLQGLILACDAFARWAHTWPDPEKRKGGAA